MMSEQSFTACPKCRRGYRSGGGEWGYEACPSCVPGQARPLSERREDPTEFLGTGWIWDAMSARWNPASDYHMMEADEWGRLCDAGWSVLDRKQHYGNVPLALVTEIRRLRGEPLPSTDAARQRYSDLADRCQRLDDDLHRKRAQCDELADRVADLEAALARGRR